MTGPINDPPPPGPGRLLPAARSGSPFDAIRREDERGEHWLARELMTPLGYDQWRRFEDAIGRAMATAANTGTDVSSSFTQVTQLADAGNLGHQLRSDFRLTRYAAYLVAMNGDPRKPEIAAAQTYFAVRTREAEIAPTRPALPQTYAQALRELAATVEEAERAKAELAEAAPKAQSWDTLATANGDLSVADAAKILNRDPAISTGQQRLFTWLATQDWIFRSRVDNRWRAYQRAVDSRWLSELPQHHVDRETGDMVLDPPQIRITVKGLHRLHVLMGGVAPLRLREQPALPGGAR